MRGWCAVTDGCSLGYDTRYGGGPMNELFAVCFMSLGVLILCSGFAYVWYRVLLWLEVIE